MYFKITNAEENHHGFQYMDGLNVLIEEFNDDPNQSCCAGGLYFTDVANIFNFLSYGIYLREVILPTKNANFKMIKDKDKDNNKWRANMIILGKRFNLCSIDTFEYLIEKGANIHANNDYVFRWSAENGHLDVVKYLIEKGADVHADNDCALRWSAENGHLDVVKYLIEKDANVHVDNDYALRWSAENGHLDVVKYLIENGANIHADNDYALDLSAEINADDENGYTPLLSSATNGHYNVYEYLQSKIVS